MSRSLLAGTLALIMVLPLGGCTYRTWSGGDHVAFGGRADRVDDLRTSVVTHEIAPAPGATVRITNVAGRIDLRQGDDERVTMEAHVHARGHDDTYTETLLAEMQWIETTDDDGRRAWGLAYPTDRHRTLHYVTDDRAFTMKTKRDGRTLTITTEKRPGAPTLFADITVTFPAGTPIAVDTLAGPVTGGTLRGSLDAETTVGTIGLDSFDGNLSLDTDSGDIVVSAADGTTRLDTGSGNIRVQSLAGTAVLDTGSGNIEVATLTGDADLDTGSGDITVANASATRVRADTGSGDIRIEGGTVDALHLDTGSGRVEIDDVEFVELHGDTGSGGIMIRSSLAGAERIHADTGSGTVTIIADEDASFDVHASMSSGRMHVGFDDVTVDRSGWREVRARRGDGRPRIHVDTGSGNCVIKPAS